MNALSKAVSLAVLLSAALGLSSQATAQVPTVAPTDLVNKGDVWEGGELIQKKGKYKTVPGEEMKFTCKLTITKSMDGGKFWAELHETQTGNDKFLVIYTVNGTVTTDKDGKTTITWTSDGVKKLDSTSAITGVIYTAELKEKKMTNGKWVLPPGDKPAERLGDIEGSFNFPNPPKK